MSIYRINEGDLLSILSKLDRCADKIDSTFPAQSLKVELLNIQRKLYLAARKE